MYYYDGTYYKLVGSQRNSETDTTYTEISTAEIDAGTASTLRTMTGRRAQYIIDRFLTYTATLINKTLTSPVINTPTITSPILTVSALGNLGTSEAIDWSTASHFSGTVDQSTLTITHSNEVSGKGITLYLTGSASSASITFSNVDVWLDNSDGSAPAVPGDGETLIVTMQFIGSTCYASATGNYAVYA